MHYSLQHDHAHFIVEANGRQALGFGMRSLGARFARAVNRVFDRSGPVLCDRYHLHVLRSPVALARTRLLSHGWRRGRGRISLADVPGAT